MSPAQDTVCVSLCYRISNYGCSSSEVTTYVSLCPYVRDIGCVLCYCWLGRSENVRSVGTVLNLANFLYPCFTDDWERSIEASNYNIFPFFIIYFFFVYFEAHLLGTYEFGVVISNWWLLFSHSVMTPLCDPMDGTTPGLLVLHHPLELAQTRVHLVSDAIQPSHPLSPPSPPAFNLSHIRIFSNDSALHIRWPKYWS